MDSVGRMKRYAFLKTEADKIKNELEFLQDTVLADVMQFEAEHGRMPSIEGVGHYSIQKRKAWEYDQAYKNADEALKQLKADEQADGRATFTENETLVFKQEKVG